jgi:uncharacterized protein YjbI with pentapeptide repeats
MTSGDGNGPPSESRWKRFKAWAGIGERRWTKSPDEELRPAKTLWDWLQLLIVPVILIGATLAWSALQTRGDNMRDDRAREDATLQGYLDAMSTLIFERHLVESRQGDAVREVARADTLTALHRLNGERKGQIVRFLAEAQLLATESGFIPGVLVAKLKLDDADLAGANLAGAVLREANLTGVNLRGADLRGAILETSVLDSAHLQGANLGRVSADYVSLKDAHLRGANLAGAEARYADLRGADLRGADLRGADLRDANLRDAKLNGAFLKGTDLSGSELAGADLREVHLQDADLQDAMHYDQAQRG